MSGINTAVLRGIRKRADEAHAVAGEAHNNEQVTRDRVNKLELRANDQEAAVGAAWAVLSRGLLGRLRWLLTGR